MLFLLIRSSQTWLEAHGLGFLRVFTFVTFQATVAIVLSFLICVLLGGRVIDWLRVSPRGCCESAGRSVIAADS